MILSTEDIFKFTAADFDFTLYDYTKKDSINTSECPVPQLDMTDCYEIIKSEFNVLNT